MDLGQVSLVRSWFKNPDRRGREPGLGEAPLAGGKDDAATATAGEAVPRKGTLCTQRTAARARRAQTAAQCGGPRGRPTVTSIRSGPNNCLWGCPILKENGSRNLLLENLKRTKPRRITEASSLSPGSNLPVCAHLQSAVRPSGPLCVFHTALLNH